jgi:hypothetical protein
MKAKDVSGLKYGKKNADEEMLVIKKGWVIAMRELKIA